MTIKLFLRVDYPQENLETDKDYCDRVTSSIDKVKETLVAFKQLASDFNPDQVVDTKTPFSDVQSTDLMLLHKKNPDDSLEEYLRKTIFWIDSELSVLELVQKYILSEYDKQQKV